jgi:predicted alpha/beta-hydrolase family hydrolase
MTATWQIPVGEEQTSAIYDDADSRDAPVFVAAHGAGGNIHDRSMVKLVSTLTARGVSVVRFNFLYREKKSGRPDAMPKLEKCFESVIAHVRSELDPKTLIIGGRSMGGRAASMLAARNFNADGLLLLAYPLHPPGQPEKLRDAHLKDITMPVICFNGTRDAFCTRELMERALKTVKTKWEMHWIDQADHSFHVPKSSGRTDAQVLEEVGDAVERWLASL